MTREAKSWLLFGTLALVGLAQACGAGLEPPDDPLETVMWAQEHGARVCAAAEAARVPLTDEQRAVCLVLRGSPFEVVVGEAVAPAAPSGDGPDAGAATPAVGGASNGVRNVGGSG